MWFAELLAAFLIALVFSFILVALFGRDRTTGGAWPFFLFFFLILMLAVWAGGRWVVPFGPVAWGIAWLPLLFVGFFVALLIAAVLASEGRVRRRVPPSETATTRAETEAPATSRAALGGFFWLLLLVLAIVILIGYAV